MIANFFDKTKPVNFLNIGVLLFVFYFVSAYLKNSISYSAAFLIEWMGLFLVLIIVLLLFRFIVEKNKLTKDNSYALLLFVVLLGTFYESLFSNLIIFSNLILLLSYRKLYSLRSGLNTKMKLFDAAFWVGIATLIYSWSILYLLLIYVGVLIYKKANFKNLLIPVVGLLTPIFIYFTYHFYFDSLPFFYDRFNFTINISVEEYSSIKFLIPLLFLLMTLLWSVIVVTPKVVSISNNLKLSWNVLVNHLLISCVLILVSPMKNGSEVFYLIFPSSIIISNFLQNSKSSLFRNVMLYLFLIIAVSVYFL